MALGKSWWSDENGPRNIFGPAGMTSFTYSAANVETIRVVTGNGCFPTDMLRYDRAFCMTPVPHPDHEWGWKREYQVVVGFAKRYNPTIPRWESFGWRVGMAIPHRQALLDRVVSWQGRCHRCGEKCNAYAMSIFNEHLLCSDCEERERRHPDFSLARDTLRYSFKQGDLTFMGIGGAGAYVAVADPPGIVGSEIYLWA